jgi:putative membrane protein
VSLLPSDKFRRRAFLLFLALFAVTCIRPPYLHDFILQHVLTVTSLALLLATDRVFNFSRLSYSCILAFGALHLLGARYLYSFVPYDEWSRWLLGGSISDVFALRRNHYDRLVHFAYGVLMTLPVREVLLKKSGVKASWSYAMSVGFVLATGSLYEIAEWTLALVMSPETAEHYNGQQGDVWDPQRDTALAFIGALLCTGFIRLRQGFFVRES